MEQHFLNKFLLIFFLIYLIKFNYIKNNQAVILLLYPSLFLYSSLMLKETTIIFFLSISYIFLVKDKYLYSLLCLFLVSIIKPHLSILFGIAYLFYTMQFKAKIKFKYILLTIFFIGIILYFEKNLLSNLLSQLNQFIYNFHLENVNYNKEELGFTKELIKFDLSSVFYLFSQSLLFWFKPFLHNAENLPQMIQSFENIFVMIIILYYLKNCIQKILLKRTT